MERVNLMLDPADREFLNRLSIEIRETTGGKVSGSEIVRAGLIILRELHRLPPGTPGLIPPVSCASGAALETAGIACVRMAAINARC